MSMSAAVSRSLVSAEPINTGFLETSDGHRLYYEERGRRGGLPIVSLHGGPGTGFRDAQLSLYDPEKFHIIAFDQRGCGRSTPLGALVGNTTQALVADIESLRRHLQISRWIVAGGSWGAALTLLYAIAYPENCLGLIVRGAFLARPREIRWWFDVTRGFFPYDWARFSGFVGSDDPDEIMARYFEKLTTGPEEARCQAALEWKNFERACGSISPRHPNWNTTDRNRTIATALVHVHFFRNGFFLQDGIDLTALAQRYHSPCEIIHGRFDVVCPLETASLIHAGLPHSHLQIVETAGHALEDDGNREAMGAAAERLRHLLQHTHA
jgi:proline iminopeptidase